MSWAIQILTPPFASGASEMLKRMWDLEPDDDRLTHRDCRRKLLGKEPCAGRAGSPFKPRDGEAGCPQVEQSGGLFHLLGRGTSFGSRAAAGPF